jgi:hypothetical protein
MAKLCRSPLLCLPPLVLRLANCQKEGMARPSQPESLTRKRWLRALRIAGVLFKEEGYHTTYLDEVEAFVQRTAAPEQARDAPQQTAPTESQYRVDHYPYSRFWAVYDGTDLVAVTVYRKGAAAITARLAEKDRRIAALERQLAAMTAPPSPLPSPAAQPVTTSSTWVI